MRIPEAIRKMRAAITGYFWLSCPRCGKGFAGYEDSGGMMEIPGDDSLRRLTCPECPDYYAADGTEKAKRHAYIVLAGGPKCIYRKDT